MDTSFPGFLTDGALIFIILLGVLFIAFGAILAYPLYRIIGRRKQEEQAQQAVRRETERAKQAERERLKGIYDLISTMTATLKYERVLDIALDLGGNIMLGPDGVGERVYGAVLLFKKGENGQTDLRIGSARRFTPADMRISLPGAHGVLNEVISSGEAMLCKYIDQDEELKRFIALRACKVAYCIPLRTGLDTYGILLFAHPEPEFFTSGHRETLDIIAHQAIIAIQNARLYSDLEQEKERMLEIQDEARKKLARDLHDGPTQSVSAIAMRVNFVRRLMERDAKSASDELNKIEELALRTTKEIRHMLFTLRPLVLESQGLVAALEAMAEKMRDTFEQNVLIDVDQKVLPDLEIGKQTVIFYIVEEAVNNARKYAQAGHIWVRLKGIGSGLALLEIQDDGKGFDITEIDANYEKRGSLGMINMRERSELVNGIFKIQSSAGKGTRVQVFLPLNEDAADRLRRGS